MRSALLVVVAFSTLVVGSGPSDASRPCAKDDDCVVCGFFMGGNRCIDGSCYATFEQCGDNGLCQDGGRCEGGACRCTEDADCDNWCVDGHCRGRGAEVAWVQPVPDPHEEQGGSKKCGLSAIFGVS